VAAQLVHGLHSYRNFYDNAANDPYGNHYDSIVVDFTVPVAPAAGALALQEELAA
jgi:hypothetical protein